MYFAESPTNNDPVTIQTNPNLVKHREDFRACVDKWSDWRRQAREDYDMTAGKQWTDADKATLNDQGRPAITINKIRPHINILSGYQRCNRYEIGFEPRTNDDSTICEVRKGMTKYVMDACDYADAEARVFLDGVIGGLGWFDVGYKWDYATLDGDAVIRRESPFNVYADPESREPDFSDAKYMFRAKWVDKEELCTIYPEHAEEIRAQTDMWDKDEDKGDYINTEPLWYNKDKKKCRLIEKWYKEHTRETYWITSQGTLIPKKRFKLDALASGEIIRPVVLPTTKVKVTVFVGEVELESMDSPYEHGEFPFVAYYVYNYGEGDDPAGVVRDIKDPQRELNKRRSQALHILNTQANSGWLYEEGSIKPEQEENIKNFGATPGAMIEVATGALTAGRVQRMQPSNPPVGLFQSAEKNEQDIPDISGINEAMLGMSGASASGRAIELNQKQAVTNIAPFFDSLRRAKKRIAYLLWGKRNRKGLIPQYYTENKCYRIIGNNGQPQFVEINKPVTPQMIQQAAIAQQQEQATPEQQQIIAMYQRQLQQANDPLRGQIRMTLNDLSEGEFDTIISDQPMSTSQRVAQFWALTDAVSKLGIPADMIFDILIDLSDVPQKDEIKRRFQQRMQQQQKAQEAQAAAGNAPKISESISFKDAPLPIQLQMAAKAGLVPQQVADAALQAAIQQLVPQAPAAQQAQTTQMMQQRQLQNMQTQEGPPQGPGGQAPQQMTQAAAQSIMAGQAPAGMG